MVKRIIGPIAEIFGVGKGNEKGLTNGKQNISRTLKKTIAKLDRSTHTSLSNIGLNARSSNLIMELNDIEYLEDFCKFKLYDFFFMDGIGDKSFIIILEEMKRRGLKFKDLGGIDEKLGKVYHLRSIQKNWINIQFARFLNLHKISYEQLKELSIRKLIDEKGFHYNQLQNLIMNLETLKNPNSKKIHL